MNIFYEKPADINTKIYGEREDVNRAFLRFPVQSVLKFYFRKQLNSSVLAPFYCSLRA